MLLLLPPLLPLFLPLLLPLLVSGSQGQGQCIWYDTCGWDPSYEDGLGGNYVHFLNCHYDGPPKQADPEALALLKEVCPHMAEEQYLCCTARQLRDLKTNFATPAQFLEATCPTCYYNFRKNFCDLTCSPDQASFVRADHIIQGEGFDYNGGHYEGQNVSMVKNVTYFAEDQWVTDTFNSCKDVQFLGMGNVLTFLCGAWGAEDCTPQRWFDFMGDTANGYAPFMINYEYTVPGQAIDGYTGHNPGALPCYEPAPGQASGCTCESCGQDTCSTHILFTTDGSFPSSSYLCTDSRGAVLDTEEECPNVFPGTTCLFLESGHLDVGHYIEFYCQALTEGRAQWTVKAGLF